MSSGRAGSPPDSKFQAGAQALISIQKNWAIGSATGCTNGAAANAKGGTKGSVADDDCGRISHRDAADTEKEGRNSGETKRTYSVFLSLCLCACGVSVASNLPYHGIDLHKDGRR